MDVTNILRLQQSPIPASIIGGLVGPLSCTRSNPHPRHVVLTPLGGTRWLKWRYIRWLMSHNCGPSRLWTRSLLDSSNILRLQHSPIPASIIGGLVGPLSCTRTNPHPRHVVLTPFGGTHWMKWRFIQWSMSHNCGSSIL